MTKRRTNGFTLTEMLTVLAIIGILLAVALPTVTHMMKSSGLNVATREVANTLGLARQLAITQRVYARVVFPYSGSGNTYRDDMWYRTYAVMTNGDNAATASVEAAWRYVSKWEYLPVGVIFLRDNTPIPNGRGALDDDINSLRQESNLPFPNSSEFPLPVGRLAYVEFSPTGAATPVTAGIGSSTLVMTEGLVSGGFPTPTSRTSAGLLANMTAITVDSLVGRIQVARP